MMSSTTYHQISETESTLASTPTVLDPDAGAERREGQTVADGSDIFTDKTGKNQDGVPDDEQELEPLFWSRSSGPVL